ncbi:MAG: N-6 DNA methylase [Bacteroidetes bacterium]|nr:N-6 DNA methylase [Bacteroidota bacterium]
MNIIQFYISNLIAIRGSGMAVKETSYYGALENLLNEVGKRLKPHVRAIIHTRNIGSGIPDGGLFTKEQFHKGEDEIKDFIGTPPSRGVIEIKGFSENIDSLGKSAQVKKYLIGYGQVLVTNYFQFLLIGKDKEGNHQFLERYELAKSEKDFWKRVIDLKKISDEHEEGLTQFLMRVMLHATSLSEPKDVAWFLASYAKEARNRIEKIDIPALNDVKTALEDSLGMTFSGEKGDHFFRSTLVQTIFYGVFSSWVLYNKDKSLNKEAFNWKLAGWYLKVPMIKALFDRVANPGSLGRLGLIEILDWTSNVLNRVERDIFFNKFEETEAVLYFYEPFLEAFDSQLRKDLGVWYTPPEIVKYMVEKVDRSLRDELGISRGLADKRVYVLDPCCGTGAYLVEVLKRINKTLQQEGSDALTGEDLKEAAINRIFGFEILPAPFVVAHLQLGVLLENFGAKFIEDKNERMGVYLTNALTGWEKTKEGKQIIAFPEMQDEKDAAEKVKIEKPILVIIGNPPYNAFAGTSSEEEGDLVDVYKEGLITKWGIKKFNLDELYVRFLRVAERRINLSGEGIVSFISSFTFIFKESFVVARERLLNSFSSIWIDSLNGSSRETGKLTPEGKPDPSIFSTKYNTAGIKVGTAISLLVKKRNNTDNANVYFREFWGTNKRNELIKCLDPSACVVNYEQSYPEESNLYSFKKIGFADVDYDKWLSLDLIPKIAPFQGLDEDRKFDLIEFDKEILSERIQKYYDKSNSLNDLKPYFKGLISNSAGFDAVKARLKILKEDAFDEKNLLRYLFRAFDRRYCYYSEVNPLWKRPRPELRNQLLESNSFLMCRKSSSADPEGIPFFYSNTLFARDAIKGHATAIPFKITQSLSKTSNLTLFESKSEDNISDSVRDYLNNLGCSDGFVIWWHVLAIGYSPAYISGNQGAIKISYPKIPFPDSELLLKKSADIGKKIGDLLDVNNNLEGITTKPSDFYKGLGVISSTRKEFDLGLNARWGNKTDQGIMPGKGKYLERDYTEEEYVAFEKSGVNKEQVHHLLGSKTVDVYLNETTYWRNMPLKIWDYYIGGYQVIKKWLSYREESIINRPLNKDEVREVTNIIRRIAGILLLRDELDQNYAAVKNNLFQWNKLPNMK